MTSLETRRQKLFSDFWLKLKILHFGVSFFCGFFLLLKIISLARHIKCLMRLISTSFYERGLQYFSISFWLKLHTAAAFWSFKEFRASAAINLKCKGIYSFVDFPSYICCFTHCVEEIRPVRTCKALTSPHTLFISEERASLNMAGPACAAALLTAGHTGTRENESVCVWGLRVWNIVQACMQITALSYSICSKSMWLFARQQQPVSLPALYFTISSFRLNLFVHVSIWIQNQEENAVSLSQGGNI